MSFYYNSSRSNLSEQRSYKNHNDMVDSYQQAPSYLPQNYYRRTFEPEALSIKRKNKRASHNQHALDYNSYYDGSNSDDYMYDYNSDNGSHRQQKPSPMSDTYLNISDSRIPLTRQSCSRPYSRENSFDQDNKRYYHNNNMRKNHYDYYPTTIESAEDEEIETEQDSNSHDGQYYDQDAYGNVPYEDQYDGRDYEGEYEDYECGSLDDISVDYETHENTIHNTEIISNGSVDSEGTRSSNIGNSNQQKLQIQTNYSQPRAMEGKVPVIQEVKTSYNVPININGTVVTNTTQKKKWYSKMINNTTITTIGAKVKEFGKEALTSQKRGFGRSSTSVESIMPLPASARSTPFIKMLSGHKALIGNVLDSAQQNDLIAELSQVLPANLEQQNTMIHSERMQIANLSRIWVFRLLEQNEYQEEQQKIVWCVFDYENQCKIEQHVKEAEIMSVEGHNLTFYDSHIQKSTTAVTVKPLEKRGYFVATNQANQTATLEVTCLENNHQKIAFVYRS